MKTLTVRLPEPLVADIEAESRGRKISKSDVVRERLERAPRKRRRATSLNAIADLIGSVDGLLTCRQCGARCEIDREVLGRSDEPRRRMPGSHDRNAC